MILLRMVSFIEDEEIDLVNFYERAHQALVKNFCCAYYDHVLSEDRFPGLG